MNLKRTLAVIGAAVTCPCHLPIWAALLGGTAVGGWVSRNLLLAGVAAAVLFLLFLRVAFGEGSPPGMPGSQNGRSRYDTAKRGGRLQ